MRAFERRTRPTVDSLAGPERFAELFEAPHDPTDRRVVVLADKYDEPIQDALRDVDGTCASLD